MLHLLGIAALIGLVIAILAVRAILVWLGFVKPDVPVPSGIKVGERAKRVLGRNSPAAQLHNDALNKMTSITDWNGEVWRVHACTPIIDNQYEFILERVR